jgi:hypothetical protein
MAFQEGEEELQRVVVAVLSKTGNRGAVTGHVAVAGELTAHMVDVVLVVVRAVHVSVNEAE